jgi:phenylacetate-CoA ligase
MPETHWNTERETLGREEITAIQERKLRQQVEYAYENTAYYRELFDEEGLSPGEVRTIDDYQRKVPFVIKQDLRDRDRPQDFIAADESEVQWIHASTGTTGKPTHQVVADGDMEHLKQYLARYQYATGARENDTVLSLWMYYHLFTYWAEAAYDDIGVNMFRRGGFPFEIENDLETISLWTDLDPDILHVPFNGLMMIREHLESEGMTPEEVFPSLKTIHTGGAIWTDALRESEESYWGVPIYDVGGPTDTLCCAVSLCAGHEDNWYHWWEDLMFPELIDFDTQELLGPGERGELVYTNLDAAGTPYLRWRSEDAVLHGGHDCVCGRKHLKGKLLGRTGDRIQIDQNNVFLRDVEEVIHEFDEIRHENYQVVRAPDGRQDRLVLRLQTDALSDGVVQAVIQQLESDIDVPVDVESFDVDTGDAEWKPDKIVEEEV